MSDKKYVTYEEFGAKGDGVTDDFFAIKAAHDYANENGLPVKADDNATYYIRETRKDGEPQSVIIKTDTSWGEAKFIIDDTDISLFRDAPTYPMYKAHIFRILSDYGNEKIEDRELLDRIVADGLNRDTKKINIGLPYPAMIIPYNAKHRVYRRRGYGGFRGGLMHEVIVLDKDGNIDPSTPVMFDYNSIDYIEVIRLDIKPITIDGGTFTTKASRVNNVIVKDGVRTNQSGYIMRGIHVVRSYTTVKNVKHYVTGELELSEQVKNGEIVCVGYGYHGFFAGSMANEITFDGCVLTGRRCYHNVKGGHLGTYDLTGNEVNKIVFKNCTQSNFWIKIDENNNITAAKEGDEGATTSLTYRELDGITVKVHWGIGGTNFCKNMEYIGCTLSRFDAHAGLYNGRVIDSTVNYLAITGNGDFIVENTRWFSEGTGYNSNSLIHLRADYGSTWEGEIKMKNIKAHYYTDAPCHLYMHSFTNWYYGYVAHYPTISIDNLEVYDILTREPVPAGFNILVSGDRIKTEPAMHLPETMATPPIYSWVDDDGDGLIDGTDIPYTEPVDTKGVTIAESRKNLNPIVPPAHIAITSNKGAAVPGKCKLAVYDTANYKDISDGGFFGKTDFITDKNTYHGTDFVGRDTETFEFVTIE